MIWFFVVPIVLLQMAQLALSWAPMRVWRRIDEWKPSVAFFLWGATHLFGPRLHAMEKKPWL